LGYRRLQQAEGVGHKGLSVILAWLQDYGYELPPPEPTKKMDPGLPHKRRRDLQFAMRLLNMHGYVVRRADDPLAD